MSSNKLWSGWETFFFFFAHKTPLRQTPEPLWGALPKKVTGRLNSESRNRQHEGTGSDMMMVHWLTSLKRTKILNVTYLNKLLRCRFDSVVDSLFKWLVIILILSILSVYWSLLLKPVFILKWVSFSLSPGLPFPPFLDVTYVVDCAVYCHVIVVTSDIKGTVEFNGPLEEERKKEKTLHTISSFSFNIILHRPSLGVCWTWGPQQTPQHVPTVSGMIQNKSSKDVFETYTFVLPPVVSLQFHTSDQVSHLTPEVCTTCQRTRSWTTQDVFDDT